MGETGYLWSELGQLHSEGYSAAEHLRLRVTCHVKRTKINTSVERRKLNRFTRSLKDQIMQPEYRVYYFLHKRMEIISLK